MRVLDLGCGKRKYTGAIGVNNLKTEQTDIIHDLNKGIPFKDNSVDFIYCSHTLEHLNDVVYIMEEIHRVGKNHAKVIIIVPFFSWSWAFQDITHKHFFGYYSFDTFTEVKKPAERFLHYSQVRFKINKRKIIFSDKKILKPACRIIEPLINKFSGIYQRFFAFILPSRELYFELEIIK